MNDDAKLRKTERERVKKQTKLLGYWQRLQTCALRADEILVSGAAMPNHPDSGSRKAPRLIYLRGILIRLIILRGILIT